MDVSAESVDVRGSTCPYISTKGPGMHGVTSTDNYTVKMVVSGRTKAYDEYGS